MASDLQLALEIVRSNVERNIRRHPVALSAERIAEGRAEVRIEKSLTEHGWNLVLWALEYAEGKA